MKEITFPVCFIEVNRMRLICGGSTSFVFQAAYVKRQWIVLFISQFQFRYIFLGTSMRVMQVS
jgi:hypothetical protein